MGAQGITTVNFGAFPGASDTSTVVTGQAGIIAGSCVEAWIAPTATADHSADEHLMEQIKVVAGAIVAGTGFTIYALIDAPQAGLERGASPRLYGLWTVAWVWN